MTADQLELFTPHADPPPARFDPDQALRCLARNTQGTCCGHWRAEHEDGGGPCRFCGPWGGCQQFSDEPVEPPCCRTSPTGHCTHGRHDQCPYSPGGGCYGGIIRSQYVLLPPAAGWPGTNPTPELHTGNGILADVAAATHGYYDMVELVEPQHRIVCGCKCHQVVSP